VDSAAYTCFVDDPVGKNPAIMSTKRFNDVFAASNLILDAVTVHDSETARVIWTLDDE
jgi:hypothetical protein